MHADITVDPHEIAVDLTSVGYLRPVARKVGGRQRKKQEVDRLGDARPHFPVCSLVFDGPFGTMHLDYFVSSCRKTGQKCCRRKTDPQKTRQNDTMKSDIIFTLKCRRPPPPRAERVERPSSVQLPLSVRSGPVRADLAAPCSSDHIPGTAAFASYRPLRAPVGHSQKEKQPQL